MIKKLMVWKELFSAKEISSDCDFPFNFKNSSWYSTIIFLVTFITVPIVYSLLKGYVFNIAFNESSSLIKIIDLIVKSFVPIIGIIIIFIYDWNTIVKKGAWAAYAHFIFTFISTLFIDLFLIQTGIISINSNDPISKAIIFFVRTIIQFLGSLLVIFTNKMLRSQIIATLKEVKLELLFWIPIFFSFFSVLNLCFDQISLTANPGNYDAITFYTKDISRNQMQLNFMASVPFGLFALILGGNFLVPINEEISYRFGIFSIVRYKWLSFITSVVYFSSMHVMDYQDWNMIFGYLAASIILSLFFIFTRGNVTYTIGLHMLLNITSTIALLMKR